MTDEIENTFENLCSDIEEVDALIDDVCSEIEDFAPLIKSNKNNDPLMTMELKLTPMVTTILESNDIRVVAMRRNPEDDDGEYAVALSYTGGTVTSVVNFNANDGIEVTMSKVIDSMVIGCVYPKYMLESALSKIRGIDIVSIEPIELGDYISCYSIIKSHALSYCTVDLASMEDDDGIVSVRSITNKVDE